MKQYRVKLPDGVVIYRWATDMRALLQLLHQVDRLPDPVKVKVIRDIP